MKLIKEFCAAGIDAGIYGGSRSDIVYFLSGHMGRQTLEALPELPCSVVLINVPDWNADLTPWSGKRVFRGGEDFKGLAGDFLGRVTGSLLPQAEQLLGAVSPTRYIAGGSLGGLFAVWSLYNTDLFAGAVSTSGSFWYDGFTDYAAENIPLGEVKKLYLSLGDQESLSSNPRFAKAETCTQRILEIFLSRGTESVYVPEPGDHFTDPEGRLLRGLEWLFS